MDSLKVKKSINFRSRLAKIGVFVGFASKRDSILQFYATTTFNIAYFDVWREEETEGVPK